MKVSIIICTKNRAQSLRETLAALGSVHVPEEWASELIVVDNGSTDNTNTVVRDAGISNMEVRYLHEPRRGKGYAYNSGIAAATGEILLFTDDDVQPPTNWIEKLCRPIMEGKADA